MADFPAKVYLSEKGVREIWDIAHKEMVDLPVNVMREVGEKESRALCFSIALSKFLYKEGITNFIVDYDRSERSK